jgi:transposase
MRRKDIPPKDELADLYVGQRISTRDIAARYGVVKGTIKKWLAFHGIEARPAVCGLAHRGMTPPDRDTLFRLVHVEHKSYDELAEIFGFERTAVRWWLDKFGIDRPTCWGTRRRGAVLPDPPNESTLRDLYESGLSAEAIGDRYGVSHSVVLVWCKQFGIDRRPAGFTGERYLCRDGHEVRSLYEVTVDDWLFSHDVPHVIEPRLPFDPRNLCRADFLANGWYIEVWGVQGSRTYNEKRRWKREMFRSYRLPLIELGVDFFAQRRAHRLEARLQTCLKAPAVEGRPRIGPQLLLGFAD